MTKSPFALSPSAKLRTGLSKGMSEWAQGRFGKLRTGFDKLSPNEGERCPCHLSGERGAYMKGKGLCAIATATM